MSPRLLVQDTFVHDSVGARADTGIRVPEISELNSMAIQSLSYMFDERKRLFRRHVAWTKRGIRWEAPSRKRTMIALLGLQRLAESGATHTFDLAAIQGAVLEDTRWIRSAGDLGLLIWFTALCAPERFSAALNGFDLDGALHTFADGRQGHTQGLAWLLAGIAHAQQARVQTHADLTDLAVATYRLLLGNQSENGIFGHMAVCRSIDGILSNRFGTFADQMYAIYALVTFARAFEIDEPLEPALNCANAVCALQGELGQWWFLYDKGRGCVASRYPLYAVHQDGLAPVALLALESCSGIGFQEPIWKGLSWISVGNKLRAELGNPGGSVTWDRVELFRRVAMYWEAAMGFVRISRKPRIERLRVRCEARAEHFGWLLYAFGNLGNENRFRARTATTA